MKAIFEFLKLPLSLPINPVWDFIITLILGEIAFWIAYTVAGAVGRDGGSRRAVHWLVRIPLYFVLWIVVCGIICLVNFIKANWTWVLLGFGIAATVGIAIIIAIRHAKKECPIEPADE